MYKIIMHHLSRYGLLKTVYVAWRFNLTSFDLCGASSHIDNESSLVIISNLDIVSSDEALPMRRLSLFHCIARRQRILDEMTLDRITGQNLAGRSEPKSHNMISLGGTESPDGQEGWRISELVNYRSWLNGKRCPEMSMDLRP